MRQPLLASIVLLLVSSFSFADDKPQIKLPPDGDADNAAKALDASPRHGEWVDIDLPKSDLKIKTWVVYPERKDKAPVVIVIHEIYGMSDWVRGVTDQLAAEGFIAIAPDLLSGRGPKGGATDSFDKQAIGPAIKDLTLDDVTGASTPSAPTPWPCPPRLKNPPPSASAGAAPKASPTPPANPPSMPPSSTTASPPKKTLTKSPAPSSVSTAVTTTASPVPSMTPSNR